MKSRGSISRALRPAVAGLVFLLAIAGAAWGLRAATASSYSLEADLPRVGSYAKLLKLLDQAQGQNDYLILRNSMNMSKSSPETAAPAAADGVQAAGEGGDFSSTNLQVAGVDEADLVKTDGQYIYQISGSRILMIKAQPAESMEVVSTLEFESTGFTPSEMYIDDTRLVVVGASYRSEPVNPAWPRIYSPPQNQIYPPVRTEPITRAVFFDIKDKSQIRKIRELDLDGSYLSSRKVGSSFYLLCNKYLDYYNIQQKTGLTPQYRDSVQGDAYLEQRLEDIRYFPDCVSPNYLIAAALDLNKPAEPADIHTYLGSGDQVYASQQNLYVAVHRNDYPLRSLAEGGVSYQPADNTTKIYRFALQPGQIQYNGAGKVPGRILNQFSMDESAGFFRIATTSGEIWRSDQYTSSNNVYTLDQNLQIAGRLENIAPGEKIYSTRFIGGRAYMVTFKQVDPFFVLDLQDPRNPKVLGKLKIPGYSDYLHPYDENHIIGFGKDTIETKPWGEQSVAFYQGMKIAIFDVTDVTQPVEMSRTLIGDRGTDSELLHNHKALLFSADRNLLAFPVTVMEVRDDGYARPGSTFPAYGSFAYQGVYVYRIDLLSGLQYRGRITHLTPEAYLKAGDVWYDNNLNIRRALYIGDILYTLSDAQVRAHRLADLTEVKTLQLPAPQPNNYLQVEPPVVVDR